jgi:hypothetical protein
MPKRGAQHIPLKQLQLHEILSKILAYQHSLPDSRAVEIDELKREGVLSAMDIEFLATHSVTYKPHQLSDFHGGDMLHMPTPEGCVFVGPCGLALRKRSIPLGGFQRIVEDFLGLPRPADELLLHIEFDEHNGMAVSPSLICFTFKNRRWRERLSEIRRVAAEFGFQPFQDEVVQRSHTLTFRISADPGAIAEATTALLKACGFIDEMEVIYSAGALDQSESGNG